MTHLWKSVFGLWMIGLGLGVNAPAQAAKCGRAVSCDAVVGPDPAGQHPVHRPDEHER